MDNSIRLAIPTATLTMLQFVGSLLCLFQRLWEEAIGWDTTAPDTVSVPWFAAIRELENLATLRISRWIGTTSDIYKTAELHVFGDASEEAYGTVAYVRLRTSDGEISIKLVCSKTRVAPTPRKKTSLPRLELLSCLLSTRLAECVTSAIRRTWSVHYWSDSKVALGWIRGDSNRWKLFVSNQVVKILVTAAQGSWRHVPGTENPADLACRGAPAGQLVNSQLWW